MEPWRDQKLDSQTHYTTHPYTTESGEILYECIFLEIYIYTHTHNFVT
jgi:hypothetical protein